KKIQPLFSAIAPDEQDPDLVVLLRCLEPINSIRNELQLFECTPWDIVREKEFSVFLLRMLRNEHEMIDATEMHQPFLVLHIARRLMQEGMLQMDRSHILFQQGKQLEKDPG